MLQAIRGYRDEEFLNLDLGFENGLALQMSFAVAYRQQIRLIQWANGNSRIL
ncbi:MAG: hypothetical protein HIU93_15485 [Acidobacteria bacterium]|nr:hypothetical protein [Acidobacteriota bacterium]